MDEQARKRIQASLAQTSTTDKQRQNAAKSLELMLGPKPQKSILSRISQFFRKWS